MQTTEFG